MYLSYYDLKDKPFNVTSDPGFLFMSKRHKEALAHLSFGIQDRKGFIEITGEIGTGKTTLCRALLNSLDATTKSAFILNPNLSEIQLLQAIVEDFGLTPKNRTKLGLQKQLNNFLIEQLKQDNNVVLILDEAQNLSSTILEHVRMLSNLETEKSKLFQIILVGQPELRTKLNSSNLKQLKQRIGIRYHIFPLHKDEIVNYIYHRLSVAGPNHTARFTQHAIDKIYQYSEGTPRLINMLCDKVLLLGFVQEKKTISEEVVDQGIRELEGTFE